MRLIICFLFFFVLNSSFAQNKKVMTEEEYTILKFKIRQNFNSNVDSALVYAYQMAESNNNKHLAFANGVMSSLLQMNGKTALSKEKYQKALYYLDKVPESRDKTQLQSYIYNYGGLSEYHRKNFSAALANYQKGIKLSRVLGDISQIVKFKANIAMVNESVGNYYLAIKTGKELDNFLHENKEMFATGDFLNRKSNINLSLGSAYEGYFAVNKDKKYLLDSAEYFYKKAITYSDDYPFNKITAKLSIGNIYNYKGDFKNAEKIYYEVSLLCQKYDEKALLGITIFNLSNINYKQKKYSKALFFCKKSDSITAITNSNELDYLKSSYQQSKIYTIFNKPELAYKYSVIYLENKKKYESKLNKEASEVNDLQGIENFTREMISVEEDYKKEIYFQTSLKVFYSVLLMLFIILLVKKKRDKNKVSNNTAV